MLRGAGSAGKARECSSGESMALGVIRSTTVWLCEALGTLLFVHFIHL